MSKVTLLGDDSAREASSISHLLPSGQKRVPDCPYTFVHGIVLFGMVWGLMWVSCVILSGGKLCIHKLLLHAVIQRRPTESLRRAACP